MCKIKYVCPDCGSDNITKDATAYWNVDTQEWALSDDMQDFTNCGDCGWESKWREADEQPITDEVEA